jgi:hypothetical protein
LLPPRGGREIEKVPEARKPLRKDGKVVAIVSYPEAQKKLYGIFGREILVILTAR